MESRNDTALKLPNLPNEIWTQIARFVPRDKRCELIDFHPAFFEIAMDDIYGNVRIYHELDESTLRCLFMSALAVSYVRTLTLRPHLFGESMPTSGHFQFNRMWKFLKNRMRKENRPSNDPPSPANTQCLLRQVKQMKKLTSLIVGCYPSDDWRSFNKATSFLDAAWTHACQLRKLKFDVPLECAETIFSTIPQFPALEDLDISIGVAGVSEIHTHTMSRLATFINLQSSTLIRLTIDVSSLKIDPSPLFSGIQYLPKLVAVAVRQPSELLGMEFSGAVDTFLRKHRTSLRDLQLSFNESDYSYPRPAPTTFFSSPIFQLDFPSLKTLDLGICYWGFWVDTSLSTELARYLKRFRCTLTELAISDDTLCFPVIQRIISLFGGVDTNLRYLKMNIHYLSCNLLDLLSSDLPHLHELVLYFYSVRPQDDGYSYDTGYGLGKVEMDDVVPFVMQLNSRRYLTWGLRHLTVHGPQFNCAGVWNKGREKLVASLPNVVTFNGVSRSEFLSKPDYTELASDKYITNGRIIPISSLTRSCSERHERLAFTYSVRRRVFGN